MGSFNSQSVNATRSRLESLSFRERERERFTTKKLSFKGRAFFLSFKCHFPMENTVGKLFLSLGTS